MLHNIGIGREHARKRVLVLVNGLNIKVIPATANFSANSPSTPLAVTNPPAYREIHNKQTRLAPPRHNRLRCPDTGVHDALREHTAERGGFEPPRDVSP